MGAVATVKHMQKERVRALRSHSGGFSLLEIIITVSILAILLLGTALILDPLQMAARARDETRTQELGTLMNTLRIARSEGGGGFDPDGSATNSCVGESAQKVFVSVPDSEAPPADLPSGWSYAQVSAANVSNTDGTGWLPIDLTAAAAAGAQLSHLPVDPINTFASGYYYTYVCDRSGFNFELTARMVSKRYRTGGDEDIQVEDGGDDPFRYETGDDLGLDPNAPTGRWTFNSGLSGGISDGTTVGFEDSQPGGNNGTAHNSNMSGMQWLSGVSGEAVELDGTDDYISIADPAQDIFDGFTQGFSVVFWVNPDILDASRRSLVRKYETTGNQRAWFLEKYNSTNIGLFLSDDGSGIETWDWVNELTFSWQQYVLTWATGAKPSLYRNGDEVARTGTDGTNLASINASTAPVEIGRGAAGSPWNGEIDDVLIYDRALSSQEIAYQYEVLRP